MAFSTVIEAAHGCSKIRTPESPTLANPAVALEKMIAAAHRLEGGPGMFTVMIDGDAACNSAPATLANSENESSPCAVLENDMMTKLSSLAILISPID